MVLLLNIIAYYTCNKNIQREGKKKLGYNNVCIKSLHISLSLVVAELTHCSAFGAAIGFSEPSLPLVFFLATTMR